jgi:putative FmdB family regulatory protein
MPSYSYFCEKCKEKFEIVCSIKDYTPQAKCGSCNRSNNVYRLYREDLLTLNASVKKSDSELKTIGDLAARNTDRMSDDQKQALYAKHNDYKEKPSQKELPKGMSRINKPKKPKWPT